MYIYIEVGMFPFSSTSPGGVGCDFWVMPQVKSAAHDVDVAKNSDDIRKLERQGAEIPQPRSP